MNQPKTQGEVLINVFMQYHQWPLLFQSPRKALTRIAYRKAGIPLLKDEPNIQTIAVAWHEEKARLGRNLTKTELADIKGWAA
jgi:hypothetical protein